MKIVVLTGSPHKNGTSNTLVNEFIRGAMEAGHTITRFDTPFLNIHPCIGCDHCGMNGPCVFNDDMPNILDTILASDMIVFATPIYYFGFSAQIKSAIDRFYSRNGQIQRKHLKSAFIVTAWNNDNQVMSAIEKHIEILIDYLNLENVGMVLAKGYGYTGAGIEKHYMEASYNLGKKSNTVTSRLG